jgi:hypothetical protein
MAGRNSTCSRRECYARLDSQGAKQAQTGEDEAFTKNSDEPRHNFRCSRFIRIRTRNNFWYNTLSLSLLHTPLGDV